MFGGSGSQQQHIITASICYIQSAGTCLDWRIKHTQTSSSWRGPSRLAFCVNYTAVHLYARAAWLCVKRATVNMLIHNSITRHGRKQEDPALCAFTSRQHRLFMEFSVLIGWSEQACRKMPFTAWAGGGGTWVRHGTKHYNSAHWWNVELSNTDLFWYVSLFLWFGIWSYIMGFIPVLIEEHFLKSRLINITIVIIASQKLKLY